MKWIRFDEQQPPASGRYLTFDADCRYFSVMNYSSRYQAFNAFDCLDDAKGALNVTHWCMLELPIDYDNGGHDDVFPN